MNQTHKCSNCGITTNNSYSELPKREGVIWICLKCDEKRKIYHKKLLEDALKDFDM